MKNGPRRLGIELLESRHLLAGGPVITEFMASNGRGIVDGWGQSSDWIEIYNPSQQPVNLAGWHLTDRANVPDKWTFPATEISPRSFLVVFASGMDDGQFIDPAGHLHTNFKIDADGEHLALLDPGLNVRSQFSPNFPRQATDISYGHALQFSETSVITDGTFAQLFIPPDDTLGITWTTPEFVPDGRWLRESSPGQLVTLPIGYDHGALDARIVAHWGLDEPVTTDGHIADDAGSHSGRSSGAVTWGSPGANNSTETSAGFDGTSGKVTIPFQPELNTESFTASAWVRPQRGGGLQVVLSNRYDSGNGDVRGFTLYHDDRERWSFWTGDGSSTWQTLNGPSVSGGRWTHVAISFDKATSTKKLFINGRALVTSTSQRFAPNPSRDFLIGAGQDLGTDFFFAGDIDDVTLFDRALPEADVMAIMNQSPGRPATGRLASRVWTDVSSLVRGQNSTVYVRVPFQVNDPSTVDRLLLDMQFDDGFVAYLNGHEIARRNLEGSPPSHDARASRRNGLSHETVEMDITPSIPHLRPGENVLAIHAANESADDPDILVAPHLRTVQDTVDTSQAGYFARPTPGARNSQLSVGVTDEPVIASHADQGFVSAFSVMLHTDAGGAAIHYTTDGTVPTAESPRYTQPIQITATTQLQARVIQSERIPGPVTVRHFVRLATELTSFNTQVPVVVIDNFGQGSIPNSGWNQTNAGIRQVPRQSASMIFFESAPGTAAFAESAELASRVGIRVRGAFSSSFAEPGYSVEAWTEFDEDATRIAPLGLSLASDWILYAPHPAHDETLIDNTFMFALSNQMGRWAPRFRYVELFLNKDGDAVEMSDHEGLYVLIEKVERSPERLNFPELSSDAAAGGWLLEINRMDPITVDGELPKNFHTAGPDGRRQTARDLHNTSSIGDDIPRQYNAYINFVDPSPRNVTERQRTAIEQWFQRMEDVLYGRDPEIDWRDPERGYARYIDVDSFMDYLILCNLSKNGDALLLSLWLYNPNPAGDGKLAMGPIWDVDLGSFSGPANSELMRNADQLWYGRLFRDPDFNQRYTDRWHELRQGPLSAERMNRIIDGLFQTIGDDAAKRDAVSNWPTRLQRMKDWVTQRAVAMDASRILPPTFSHPGGVVAPGTEIRISVAAGDVRLTLNGSDPRAQGGEIAAGALKWDTTQALVVDRPMHVVARALRNNRWSPSVHVRFSVADLNDDGQNTEADIQLLCAAIHGNDIRYDQDRDGQMTLVDLHQFVKAGWNTSVGDANLDGTFNSADLVLVFTSNRFESVGGPPATWSSGDWNCDRQFTTADLVAAFTFGSYSITDSVMLVGRGTGHQDAESSSRAE